MRRGKCYITEIHGWPCVGSYESCGWTCPAGYPSDAQWEESGLLTSPHCCLSSVCPRPCLIHRMNFAHISQTSPSTWATQGNSSTQVCGGLPIQPHSLLGFSQTAPSDCCYESTRCTLDWGMGDSRTHGPQERSKHRAFGDNNSSKVCIWPGSLCSHR